ncbi:MAG TPA: DEAD/DEAH box helicase family protein [Candidatus Didemnitutus sp.]|nr:DEAD/DEAH box helicase family protein [Candidatus Didemnitutus sp.]
MKLQFNAQEPYQLEAIQAVSDLFGGQPAAAGTFEWQPAPIETDLLDTLGVANGLNISDTRLLANLRAVQRRNGIALAESLASDDILGARNFSVEMETGTGKTYVFLRTIHELHRTYGWKKFVIVVPSVPIREGVMQSFSSMAEHFESLYGRVPLDHWLYDSNQASRLRQFALSNQLQVLVINIQAFDKKDVAVVHREDDRMQGRRPIEFIQQSQPIVIMDEPQNMESPNARQAIQSLNPLFTLRYSATHRNIHNLLYRLDPVRAYDLGLVKRIEVDSVTDGGDFNRPYVALEKVTTSKTGLAARLKIDVELTGGVKRKLVSVKRNSDDLFDASGRREIYRGYTVTEINAEAGFVSFGNGLRLAVGETHGGQDDLIMRIQIEETIREHFRRELSFHGRLPGERIKVLSLFFIDRVANYAPLDGKIRRWFEESYRKLSGLAEFALLSPLPVESVHSGYFARDKDGPRDSSEGKATKADNDAYQLIMRDKERLLSPDEPLRFIFSHSALREGWDNPNVFQICTLREGQSEIRKRQEIGRGLRLARMENGVRCTDTLVNRLTLIANESFADFARKLQEQLEEDCGVQFKDRILNRRERKKVTLRKERFLSDDFRELWERISRKTRYSVEFSTGELVNRASRLVQEEPDVSQPEISVSKSEVRFSVEGVEEAPRAFRPVKAGDYRPAIPDIIGYLQRETELTRSTLVEILVRSGRIGQAIRNPQEFMERAASAIQHAKRELMVGGIRYERIEGQSYEMRLFESDEIEGYLSRLLPVENSIYDAVEYDSEVERNFAAGLDAREDIKLFVKLPRWFVVKTPLGDYRPDWAVVRESDNRVYLVIETKGSKDLKQLPDSERWKVKCGEQHFYDCLGVSYKVATEASDLR